ncbi:MAG: metal ABC transporter permease [Phycisphaerae bacterium]
MSDFAWHGWIIATAAAAAVACAVPGVYLVLRRMSMMGDAISHAVLPGLAGAFIMAAWFKQLQAAGELPGWLHFVAAGDPRSSWLMFAGAVLVGVFTSLLTQLIHKAGRVEEQAAMGVAFTTLFALGLVMIEHAGHLVDLDPRCVLYGTVELAPLRQISVFGLFMPRSFAQLAAVLLLNLAFVGLFYKELKLAAFGPASAHSLGVNATVMHYGLMAVVAVTTVAAFEAVGSILVIAMLVAPAATGLLLSRRFGVVLLLAVLLAAASAVLGHLTAVTLPPALGLGEANTAGSMAAASGLLFVLAMLFSPGQGVLTRRFRTGRRARSAPVPQVLAVHGEEMA